MGMTVKKLAQEIGVTDQTIRNWVKSGKIPYHVAPSNRAYFTDDDLKRIIKKGNQNKTWAYYARSSCGSNTALDNQIKLLTNTYGTNAIIIKDKGSGLNEKRKGLNKLLNLTKTEQITDIAITTQDRLTRFGYEYLKRYCTDHNVRIHVLNGPTEQQPEQELINDFMALLASFSGRYYHLRNTENKQKFLKEVNQKASTHAITGDES